jgi:protein-tyrosine phosphatase
MTQDTAAIPLSGRVLVVCTANVCRSPLAAELLREGFTAADVGSAGVHALTDAPMCLVSASLLPADGRPQHVARQLTTDLVGAADLVLTMERDQRSSAVRLAPGSQNRVFTLREAAALAEGLVRRGAPAPDDVAGLAGAMHAIRGIVPVPGTPRPKRRWWARPVPPEDPFTIEDGHGLAEAEHRAAADQVADTSRRLLDALRSLQAA